jgi:hypothetical protein
MSEKLLEEYTILECLKRNEISTLFTSEDNINKRKYLIHQIIAYTEEQLNEELLKVKTKKIKKKD